ncbi:hypothetical protein QQ045_027188 [Rhodiola kirilowii]
METNVTAFGSDLEDDECFLAASSMVDCWHTSHFDCFHTLFSSRFLPSSHFRDWKERKDNDIFFFV